jgi:RHS repeat-associated protein
MTSDGTNSYSWDAENRLIKITYPGSGNNSQFSYDGFGRNVSIVETVSGSVTSTKQFVWAEGDDVFRPDAPCEARNITGTVTAQYFALGDITSATSHFYTPDHLGLTDSVVMAASFSQLVLIKGLVVGFNPVAHSGSTREVTNSGGSLVGQFAYDPFGRTMLLQGSTIPDFQFAGYYMHTPSGLNLTRSRAFDSSLGRFINPDPIGIAGGINLYAYVGNKPNELSDPVGLQSDCDCPSAAPGDKIGRLALCTLLCTSEACRAHANCTAKGLPGAVCSAIYAAVYAKCMAWCMLVGPRPKP